MNRKKDVVLALMAVVAVCALMAFTSGCGEAEKSPVWGNGDLPARHIEFFGESNGSRLDFMQNRVIAEIAKRVLALEGNVFDPNEVR